MNESPVVHEHQFFPRRAFQLVIIQALHPAFSDNVWNIIEEFIPVIRLARIARPHITDEVGGKRRVRIAPHRLHGQLHAVYRREIFASSTGFRS